MLSNDLKKGDMVLLNDGFEAKILDNKKGSTREVETDSLFNPGHKDRGSIYAANIAFKIEPDGTRTPVTTTPQAQKARDMCDAIFGGL